MCRRVITEQKSEIWVDRIWLVGCFMRITAIIRINEDIP